MKCPRCDAENREGRRFCGACGASLSLACQACGFTNEAGERFCGGCGQPLTPAAAPSAAAPSPPSPQTYTPKHLAEKILTSKSALEGERKQVTVLFADIKGSMELLAARDPEEARKLLDAVLGRMMDAVHHYEGTVNQVLGDGIMALFGAPIALEEHALRACYAALRMQDSIRRYAEEIDQAGSALRIRVGLNSGEVVVRAINSDLHMDYTAIGQTTHLAARMEQTAPPGSILMTAEAFRLVEGYVEARDLGRVEVKGLMERVEVFELIGASASDTRLQVSAARGLTPFVGRDAELEVLPRALARAGASRGQIVALVGDAGVGKSRLIWEFLSSPHIEGWLVIKSWSVSYGKATAYLPVIELLKSYFDIENREAPSRVAEKVRGRVLALDKTLESTLPPLLALLDVTTEDGDWSSLDPRERRHRTLEAVRRLLLRESQMRPLVMVFEDLHWIDSETQAFLDNLVDSIATARILLLVNYRPEYQHRWGGKGYYTQLRLDPLVPENANELLDALLGDSTDLQPLKQTLIERTEGNPFFLEESVRTLVETQALIGSVGAYRLAQPLTTIRIPGTVQAILAARIDRLSPGEKHLLQCASVIGREVPFVLLQQIAEMPEEQLRLELTHLQRAEFLYETSVFPESEYTFKHALTHDVAYGGLLHERRRSLHAGMVTIIESVYSGRGEEQVEQLALHAYRGELWPKAVEYFRRAGAKAMALAAYREAAMCFEQALVALRKEPESRENQEQVIDLLLDFRGALYPLGEFNKMLEPLREAERLAEAIGDSTRLCWVSLHLGDYFRQIGDLTTALGVVERAHAIAETLQNRPVALVASYYLGLSCHTVGEYRRAAENIRTAVQKDLVTPGVFARAFSYTQAGSFAGYRAVALNWLTRSLAECGEFEEAVARGREAVEVAEGIDNPYSLVQACVGLGHLLSARGDFELAIRPLERAVAVARQWNLDLLAPQAMRYLGRAYAMSARVTEGLDLVREAARGVAARALLVQEAPVARVLGEVCLLADQPDEGSQTLARALSLARERGQRGDEAYALHLLATVSAARAEHDAAAAQYGNAMQLAKQLGMRPLIARCHLDLGRLFVTTANRYKAEEHLLSAIRLFSEMDMRSWLRRVATPLRELGCAVLVGRRNAALYERLRQMLSGEEQIEVILDRRITASGPPPDQERRQPDTRRDLEIEEVILVPRDKPNF